jgi:hypothetical protein
MPSPTALGAGTDYTNVPTGTYHDPPDYRIVTNPATAFPNGDPSFGDHTSGTEQMFFFDGAETATTRIWYDTVTLNAGTTYMFSFWGASSNNSPGAAVPLLIGEINGTPIAGSVALTTVNATWLQYTATFTVSSTGSYTLSINDEDVAFFANDGAIDDVLLTHQ